MSFVNPLFLTGSLIVAIPVLLHLIKREHARKINFPSLMYLQRISRRSIRYQRLRHILLLLMRVLAVLLIVFAFMRPYQEQAPVAVAAAGRIATAHIILIDNSLSMGYQNRWAQAKNAAIEIIRRAGPDDKFAVLEFSDRTTARVPLTGIPSEALEQIDALELSDQSTRYGQALRAGERIALDAATGKRIIHLISDFQKSGYTAEDREFRLGSGMELHPIDLGSANFSNLSFRDIRVSESESAEGDGIKINASTVNFGNADRKNVPVHLSLDGRSIEERRMNIGKGSSQGADFLLPKLASGIHRVLLEVEDSYLPQDNRFYLTVEAQGKTLVEVIENINPNERRSPSFFLSKALNIDAFSPYKMISVSPQNMSIRGGLLIWNSASGVSTATQDRLHAFAKAGGGLALVLGDAIKPFDFNRSFGAWLPVRAEETGGEANPAKGRPFESYALMTDLRMDHPIFQPFVHPNSGSFSSARFFRYSKLSVGSGAEVLARFDNGDPALVSIAVGKGRVVVFASSADDSLNDLPLKAVYAPFWQQMLHFLDNFQERRHWMEVGDTASPRKILVDAVMLEKKGNMDRNASIAVFDPKRQRVSLAPGSDDLALDRAGFYEMRAMNLNFPVAVNASPKESDLAPGNAEEMIAGWMYSKPATFVPDERPAPEEQDRRQRFWVLLLMAACLLLIMESLLSNARMSPGILNGHADQPAAVDKN